jgi:hypothetical protein
MFTSKRHIRALEADATSWKRKYEESENRLTNLSRELQLREHVARSPDLQPAVRQAARWDLAAEKAREYVRLSKRLFTSADAYKSNAP